MTESRVTGVRHIALAVPDYDREVDFYEQLWGLKKVDHDRGVAFLAAEGSPEQYVIRFRRSQERRVDLLALSVADRATVDTLATELGRNGVGLAREPARARYSRRGLRVPLFRSGWPRPGNLSRRGATYVPRSRVSRVHSPEAQSRGLLHAGSGQDRCVL